MAVRKNRKKYLLMWISLFCLVGSAVFSLKSGEGESNGKVEIKWLYPPKYHDGYIFAEGRVWVREQEDGPWTLLDDQGNTLKTGFEAFSVGQYRDGIAPFLLPLLPDGSLQSLKGGFLNRSGDVVFSADANDGIGGIYGEGLIGRKSTNGLYGFMDLSSKWVIPPTYDGLSFRSFKEGLAAVRKGEKFGFIDKKGTVVIGFKFDEASEFSHKMAAVRVGSEWGVIDPKGRWIAEPVYDQFYGINWSDPIALEKDGKVGFINSKGDVVIDFQYPAEPPGPKNALNNLYVFSNGRAIVILDDSDEESLEYGIIDGAGDVLFREKGCTLLSQGAYTVCLRDEGQKLSLIDREGREYGLPDDFKYPFIGSAPNDSDVFTFHDVQTDQWGYFTISINHGWF